MKAVSSQVTKISKDGDKTSTAGPSSGCQTFS